MVKVTKTNPAVTAFLIIGMVIGFSIIAIGELDVEAFRQLAGLEILQVETDPTTGEIIGSVTIGKPVQSGYSWTGAQKRTTCSFSVQGFYTNHEPSWSSGTSAGGCQYAFAEWDVSDLPEDFDASDLQLKLNVQIVTTLSSVPQRTCKIGVIEQPVDTIASGQQSSKLFNPDLVVLSGDWCQTVGVKTLQLGQAGGEAFERAVKGDNRFTLSFTHTTLDKGGGCCVGIPLTYWATEGSLVVDGTAEPVSCPVGQKQEGFQCVTLECDEGFEVDGNQCSPIQCNIGEELIGSICTPIQCNVGEQLVGNDCQQIICPVGTTLIGNDCDPIICGEGFTLSGNDCTPIVCPVGNELVGSQCQIIACPLGTFLQGNDCIDITCPTGTFLDGNDCAQIQCEVGENLVGNICKPIQCQIGERLVGNNCEQITCEIGEELIGSECLPIQCSASEELEGNQCVPKPLDCPVGTVEQQNVCVQIVPQLQAIGAPINLLTITGIGILLLSFGGFVTRAIIRRGF